MSVDVFARLGFAFCVLFEWCSGCLGVLFVICIRWDLFSTCDTRSTVVVLVLVVYVCSYSYHCNCCC